MCVMGTPSAPVCSCAGRAEPRVPNGLCFSRRAWPVLAIVWTLGLTRAFPDDRANAGRITVRWPSATYRQQVSVFAVTGTAGDALHVSVDRDQVATHVLSGGQDSISITLSRRGVLRFAAGRDVCELVLIEPGDSAALEEAGGQLVDDKGRPVILLLEHRVPPPMRDRRWQTVKWLRGAVVDQRTAVPRVTLLGRGRPAPAAGRSPTAGRPRDWLACPTLTEGTRELNALIAHACSARPSGEAVVLGLSGEDLEYGTPELAFRMQVEWLLQALAARGARRLFVMSLPFAAYRATRFRWADRTMRLAARANDAEFVQGMFSRQQAVDERLYMGALLSAVRKEVKTP